MVIKTFINGSHLKAMQILPMLVEKLDLLKRKFNFKKVEQINQDDNIFFEITTRLGTVIKGNIQVSDICKATIEFIPQNAPFIKLIECGLEKELDAIFSQQEFKTA